MSSVNGIDEASRAGLAVAVVCLSVAGISVILRFICKVALKDRLHADDWCILLTLASYWAAAALTIWCVFEGSVGKQLADLQNEIELHPTPELLARTERYLKVVPPFDTETTSRKLILTQALFWGVIFMCIPQYRMLSLVIILLSTGWIVSTQIANIVTCIPISTRWHIEQPRHCTVNFDTMYLATGIIETILDVAVLALPIRMVFALQMPIRVKFTLMGIFLLGGFAILTDIIRLVFIYEPGGKDVNFAASALWLNIHMALAILCACLPVFKPLWTAWRKIAEVVREQFSTSFRSLLGSGPSSSEICNDPALQNHSLSTGSRRSRQDGHYLELNDSKGQTVAEQTRSLGKDASLY
ncbi:hypothetical protein F4677DRAFT_442773 [Hypoxylon crocopeplum]|nr:hypothetical protein F4677DRAFT_442773 [Hypoxylon crocopeplum]